MLRREQAREKLGSICEFLGEAEGVLSQLKDFVGWLKHEEEEKKEGERSIEIFKNPHNGLVLDIGVDGDNDLVIKGTRKGEHRFVIVTWIKNKDLPRLKKLVDRAYEMRKVLNEQ